MQLFEDVNWNQLIFLTAARTLRILVILVAAFLIPRLSKRVLNAFIRRLSAAMDRQGGGSPEERRKRSDTLGSFVTKVIAVVIWGIASFMILKELGFDIGPLLAGAGVVGLAVGFGAQSLVRDVISGVFLLLENQIRVGDVATINGTGGAVEQINIRTTVLRDLEGVVHVFPNGAITSLSNRTRNFSYYVFNVGVAYKENTDSVITALNEVAGEVAQEEKWAQWILEPLEILGVDQFADSAVVIKMRIKTQPGKQWQVGREMNRRIKIKFDEEGIEIPFPHRTLYYGDSGQPHKVELDAAVHEEIRRIVRGELDAAR